RGDFLRAPGGLQLEGEGPYPDASDVHASPRGGRGVHRQRSPEPRARAASLAWPRVPAKSALPCRSHGATGAREVPMRSRAVALAAVLAMPPSAGAMEVADVNFPRTMQAGGKTLTLNGAGLRTRFMFKVYAIGLYLEHPATDAATILA